MKKSIPFYISIGKCEKQKRREFYRGDKTYNENRDTTSVQLLILWMHLKWKKNWIEH